MIRTRFARSRRAGRRSRLSRSEQLEPRALLTLAVPALSSLPGASHTVYLDFDGDIVENTNWNSYYNQTTLNAPAYDIDGNAADFSATELARIEEAWKRTAEDFRPFDVNVTTVDPGVDALRNSGNGDTQWGVRAVITKESSFVTDPNERCGCGGIAYINSFNWSSDTPVWVYTSGGKSIAEAASHEVGHALGLSHDGLIGGATYYSGHGDGETGWASIMGVGYYENVSQWDRGEYYNSNNAGSGANYGSGPDDLAVISTTNGFGYRADDHGNTNGSASPLSISGTTVSASGVIDETSDQDVFSFTTGAGNVTLNINPFVPGPNLDIKADLYDANGSIVATSSPAASLSASFSLNLAAGQYFVHIDGTGVGDPGANPPSGYSDYASLGSYSISGTVVDSGAAPLVAIDNVTVDESAGTATFNVTVTGTVTSAVTVDYATGDVTAVAGSDYLSKSGTLTFSSAGVQTVTVSILDDGTTESTESFSVDLSNVANGLISDGQGIGTITDNDTTAFITIGDASGNEGNLAKGKKNSGNPQLKDFVFTISLSSAVTSSVSVDYSTADGTATVADGDYQSAGGTVVFAAGETTKTITVTVVGDNTQEPDETFTVSLSNAVGGTIAGAIGTGSILDDDTKGGGKGGRKNRIPADISGIVVSDPSWWFEGPDNQNDDGGGSSVTFSVSANTYVLPRRDSVFDWTLDDERFVILAANHISLSVSVADSDSELSSLDAEPDVAADVSRPLSPEGSLIGSGVDLIDSAFAEIPDLLESL